MRTHERLQSVVRTNPGIHVRRIAMIVGMSWNTVLHHLRTMERGGRITSTKVQGKVCWFDRSRGAYKGKEGTALLRDPVNLRMLRQVLRQPGRNQLQLARGLDLPTSVVHRRLVRMEEAGLLERLPESRSVFVFPAQDLPDLAQRAGFEVPGQADGPEQPGPVRLQITAPGQPTVTVP